MLASVSICILFLSIASSEVVKTSNEPFHWSALVYPQINNTALWSCSGAYIGKRQVIVHGLCVQSFYKFRIQLGAYYNYNEEKNQTKLEFIYDRVVRTNIGSKHDSTDNKLTLITLEEDVLLQEAYIKPLALPQEPTLVQLNDAHSTNSTVLVWHQDLDGTIDQQYLHVNVLLFLDCLAVRQEVNVHIEICASGDKVDGKYRYLCPNIGTGPLLVTGSDTDLVWLVGIGIENCVADLPQTFIRINGYWKWINEILSNVDH